MEHLEYLPPHVAEIVKQNRIKFGAPQTDRQYPTYTEMMEYERKIDSQREIREWFRKLEADNWIIDGIPLSSLD